MKAALDNFCKNGNEEPRHASELLVHRLQRQHVRVRRKAQKFDKLQCARHDLKLERGSLCAAPFT